MATVPIGWYRNLEKTKSGAIVLEIGRRWPRDVGSSYFGTFQDGCVANRQ